MKFSFLLPILSVLATAPGSVHAIDRSLRGNNDGRELKNGKGNGKGIFNGGGIGNGNGGSIGPPQGPPQQDGTLPWESGTQQRKLTGRVILGRQKHDALKAQGKSENEIAAIRSAGRAEIAKSKIIKEGSRDLDYTVIEVGAPGSEQAYIAKLKGGPKKDLFRIAEPEYIEYPVIAPNDGTEYANSWHHAANVMDSEAAWDITTGSSAVTVGICDTGIDIGHPDLEPTRLPGFVRVGSTVYEGTTCPDHAPGCTTGGDVSYVHPHGTNCAGCAAAKGNNGEGLSGVGWDIMHRTGRVTNDSGGGASSSDLAECAKAMCDYPDVKVASVSYSGVEGSLRRQAATYCKSKGSLMVNAAGNDSRDLSFAGLADDDDLIVAGATTSSNTKSGFSAYGTFVDVMAPGSSVRTAQTGFGYTSVSGTSFSCPLVAGLIALIWSADPNYGTANELTPDEVETILKAGTKPLNLVSQYNVAYGLINSRNSVEIAASDTSRPTSPPTTASPSLSPTTDAPTLASCGDGICESGVETIDNCVADCLRSLETTFAENNGINGAGGNFFKVNALEDISIVGFDIHTPVSGAGTIEIYHKLGDYVGFETNSGAWTQIMNGPMEAMGLNTPTELDLLSNPVSLLANEVHSFYILSSLGVRYTNGVTQGSLYTASPELEFFEGSGSGGLFSTAIYTPRIWNGRIHYGLKPTVVSPGTSSPTNNPTSLVITNAPTSPPTSPPSTSPPTSPPSNVPTNAPTSPPSSPPTNVPTTNSPTLQPTPCNGMDVEIKILTDNYPRETTWSLTNVCNQTTATTGGPYDTSATMYSTSMCLPTAEYSFTINDSWGDGVCCGYGQGSYEIMVDGVMAHEGGEFGSSETMTIGNCGGTSDPTSSPSSQPTSNPTSPPSSPPTNVPTNVPSSNPTSQPTSSPSNNPTNVPTSNPTSPPSNQITSPPTNAVTSNPTLQVTSPPTNTVTSNPTRSPTPIGGNLIATFDSNLGVPICSTVGKSCTSGSLIDGRASSEINTPNTLDSCTDGTSGIYHDDESIDMITVRTSAPQLQGGVTATIEAKVWAWLSGAYDTADFYYSATVGSDVTWTHIASIRPGSGNLNTLSANYTVPGGSELQAVRVNFRFSGSQSPCSGGSWDEADDLVFAVATGPAMVDAGPQEAPKPIAEPKALPSSACTGLTRKRCQAASDLCEWKNGKYKGCYGKSNDAGPQEVGPIFGF